MSAAALIAKSRDRGVIVIEFWTPDLERDLRAASWEYVEFRSTVEFTGGERQPWRVHLVRRVAT